MSYSCDVHLYFHGQPGRTLHIGEDRKARDREHAISLAKLDTQAKGWDLKKLDEVVVTGESTK